MGWVGLDFLLTHNGGLGQKIPLTRPNTAHAHSYPWPILKYQPTVERSFQYPIKLDHVVDVFALHKSTICD